VAELDVELLAARGRRAFEKFDRKTRGADHRPAHEHRISRRAITEMPDDRLGFQKVAVGLRGKRR
jgi:hypothetical protein